MEFAERLPCFGWQNQATTSRLHALKELGSINGKEIIARQIWIVPVTRIIVKPVSVDAKTWQSHNSAALFIPQIALCTLKRLILLQQLLLGLGWLVRYNTL